MDSLHKSRPCSITGSGTNSWLGWLVARMRKPRPCSVDGAASRLRATKPVEMSTVRNCVADILFPWWPGVGGVVECGPQMLGGVGPPRAPARAALREGTGVFWEPQLFGGEPSTKISCGERIRVAETTHGDDLGRPRTDTGQCRQLFPGAVPVAA